MESLLNFVLMIAASVQRSGNYVPAQWAGNDVYASKRLREVVDAVIISGGRAIGRPGDELYHMDVESVVTRWTENGTPYAVRCHDSSIDLVCSPMYLNIEAQYKRDYEEELEWEEVEEMGAAIGYDVDDARMQDREERYWDYVDH